MITAAEAIPLESWDQRITTPNRFELVLGGGAVLDHETELVWERNPGATGDWASAVDRCYRRTVGGLAQIGGRLSPGRKGWRLPTVEELASLVEPSQELPALPSGHPFEIGKGVTALGFWTHTTSAADHDQAYVVNFGNGSVFTETKQASIENPLPNLGEAWCVRGGHGHDGGH